MANSIGAIGLRTTTQAEHIEYFVAQYKKIYGNDINLSQDSPDGQMMMIFIQSILDVQDLMVQVYTQFDPDQAIGNVLDQRVAINGIQRQAGTHTVTNLTVETSQSLTLYGLDQDAVQPYRVADNEGTEWELINTVSVPAPGSVSLAFQAFNPGAVLSVPNTITSPVTVILGVVSVNNPTTYTTLGLDEESDADLKIRRQKSVSLSSQGYLQGLIAALENISGIESVFVYENVNSTVDADGVAGHSIWVIVSGAANPASIANAIYTKRNAGAGMKGNQLYNIVQHDQSVFTVRWDVVEAQALFIKFTVTSLDGVNAPDVAAIRTELLTALDLGVYEQVDINELASRVQEIDPNALVTDAGFSLTLGGTYTPTLRPTAKNKQFAVTELNTIITPIILSPINASVPDTTGTVTYTSIGGRAPYVYSIFTNNSGGSINSATGLYTAGPVASVDTIRVTDNVGNFTSAAVTVT